MDKSDNMLELNNGVIIPAKKEWFRSDTKSFSYNGYNGTPFTGKISFKNGWVIFNKKRISLTTFEGMKDRLLERAKNPPTKLRQITIGDIEQVLYSMQRKLGLIKQNTPMEDFANEQVKILTETYDIRESQAMFLVMMAINQYFTPRPSPLGHLR